MAVLLHLRRERTATSRLNRQPELLFHLTDGGHGEARPIHGGVGAGALGVEQPAIFDEQQAHRDDRRHVIERLVVLVWITVGVQRFAAAIIDSQPGLRFLRVRHEKSTTGVPLQRWRKAHLLLNIETSVGQPPKKHWQVGVAQPTVERACVGKLNTVTGARADLVVEIFCVTAQPERLQL